MPQTGESQEDRSNAYDCRTSPPSVTRTVCIVQLAVDAANHTSPTVRTQACFVIQNQCGWKVDVSGAVAPLHTLLSDESDLVRSQAACAVGNLAKGKTICQAMSLSWATI
jgi:hypothetical protein